MQKASLDATHHPKWSAHLRRAGAAIVAAGFFGTIAVAPLSMPGAFALTPAGATSYNAQKQRLALAAGIDPALDISAANAEELAAAGAPIGALFTLDDFMFRGAINWGGYKFTYYSQQVLPGEGLAVPGRHVNPAGYVSDADGYLVLAGSAPKGTIYETPFGYQGKIYDRGTVGNHLDVYIR